MSVLDAQILEMLSNTGFTVDEIQWLEQHATVQQVQKNELLLHAGEICHQLYFVKTGVLRTFHINANGSEFTRLIVSENKFCTILISFQEKVASPASIQALENGTIYRISNTHFREFIEFSATGKKMYTAILEQFQNFQIKRIEFLTQYSPQEKTEIFLKENPALEKRIADKVIASYLQITPETYSRCKKKFNP